MPGGRWGVDIDGIRCGVVIVGDARWVIGWVVHDVQACHGDVFVSFFSFSFYYLTSVTDLF